MLFVSLNEAVHDSEFYNTIKPFERTHEGCDTYLAIMGNHAGDDKWDCIVGTTAAYTTKKRWDGTGTTMLEYHVDRLKLSYIDVEAGTEHVDHQIPTPRTRVNELLKSITGYTDPVTQTVIAYIKNELNGMTTDFDGAC